MDARAWQALDHDGAARFLRAALPGGSTVPLEPLGQGDFCLAFRSGMQVIRLARHAEAAAALKREACTLARIADRLPLPVPRLAYYGPPGCPPFTVHPEITGSELTREAWEHLPRRAREKSVADMADFLRVLHALPVEIGQACGLEVLSAAGMAHVLRETTRETIRPLLHPADENLLGTFLDAAARAPLTSRPLALLHCDIAPGHVLYDPETGALTGIIDFGDIAIGDPARDFIYIYEDFGPHLLREVVDHYAGENAAQFTREIRAWYLLEATAWTVEMFKQERAEEVEHGLAEIRRELA